MVTQTYNSLGSHPRKLATFTATSNGMILMLFAYFDIVGWVMPKYFASCACVLPASSSLCCRRLLPIRRRAISTPPYIFFTLQSEHLFYKIKSTGDGATMKQEIKQWIIDADKTSLTELLSLIGATDLKNINEQIKNILSVM